jgi:hypothetical protein
LALIKREDSWQNILTSRFKDVARRNGSILLLWDAKAIDSVALRWEWHQLQQMAVLSRVVVGQVVPMPFPMEMKSHLDRETCLPIETSPLVQLWGDNVRSRQQRMDDLIVTLLLLHTYNICATEGRPETSGYN